MVRLKIGAGLEKRCGVEARKRGGGSRIGGGIALEVEAKRVELVKKKEAREIELKRETGQNYSEEMVAY
jgi:hypothetical protein